MKILRHIRYTLLSLLFVTILLCCAGAGFLYYQIAVVPAPEMSEAHINEILGRESPVYYSDGITQFGVLFEDIHRQYLKYEDIPQTFVNALIAAEDDQYFKHFGVDIPGVLRAMLANFKAGKIVQGGSTITQQTAKNLFKRESRSIRAKVKELLQALRLEYRYSKEKILEFYCNQFYVSGNGHGLGVAARYFFDKEPGELSLVEAAFIAGCVKRPNYYNPFLQKNLEDPIATKKRAMERVRYVLRQMLEEGMITREEFLAARTTELEFKQGKTSYEQNATMDLVREGVSAPVIAEYLEEEGISNISTSGARIITTIDKDLQRHTVRALRSQLSQLDVLLRGYEREEVQQEYAELAYGGDGEIVPGAFVFGTLAGPDGSDVLRVQLAGDRQGFIATDGLSNLAGALAMHRQGPWAKAGTAHANALRAQLRPGDRIYVSVRDTPGANGELLLNLERYPKVEGGAIVLQEGAIRAISGGMSNLHFNRATSARRLMGSAFKPFVYAAALQLGWSPLDMLNNRRNVFVFMDRPYFPNPDHTSPHSEVSLSWAGVTSENLASIWLLYHLTDRLEQPALREIARHVDMAPRDENGKQEDYEQYRQRIQSQFGLWVSRGMVEQAAYDAAVRALKTDFLFAGRQAEYERLTRLAYGYNFGKYADMVRANKAGLKAAEVQRQLGLLFPSFLGIRSRLPQMVAYRQYVRSFSMQVDPDLAFTDPGFAAAISENERALRQPAEGGVPGALYRTATGTLVFSLRQEIPAGWLPVSPRDLQVQLAAMNASQEHAFWQQVQLEGVLSAEAVAQVEQQMALEQRRFDERRIYSFEVLSELRDFRVMLNLQYLIHLARACGVESAIEPVLSLPLGSNVVTLSELARVYEAIITGNRYDPADAGTMARLEGESRVNRDGPSLIDRIITPDGREVYSRSAHATRIFDGATSAKTANILQNVVAYGTGRHAADTVSLHSDDPETGKKLARIKLPLPLLGKTGTANEYRNAAFFGYVPVLAQDDPSMLSLEGGYTVGVYTGYDINLPMVQGAARISGSRGALPAWSAIAQALVDHERLGDRVDIADLQFSGALPLRYPEVGQSFVAVNPKQGGATSGGRAAARQQVAPSYPASLDVGGLDRGVFETERGFSPFWRTQQAR